MATNKKEEAKRKKEMKTSTIFLLKGEEDNLRYLKMPYTPLVAQAIRMKYGDRLHSILNEGTK